MPETVTQPPQLHVNVRVFYKESECSVCIDGMAKLHDGEHNWDLGCVECSFGPTDHYNIFDGIKGVCSGLIEGDQVLTLAESAAKHCPSFVASQPVDPTGPTPPPFVDDIPSEVGLEPEDSYPESDDVAPIVPSSIPAAIDPNDATRDSKVTAEAPKPPKAPKPKAEKAAKPEKKAKKEKGS